LTPENLLIALDAAPGAQTRLLHKMALAWSPFPRSDEQPVLLRPLAPRAPTVFQAAPPVEPIDPPTPHALARRRRAAPHLMPPPPPLADLEAPAAMPPPPPVVTPPPPRFAPPADDDDDDRSVASAYRETSSRRKLDRSAVVAPDTARVPTETTSKFWGVTWHKAGRRWEAYYCDANGKRRCLGLFDTQEAAAHAVNAAIRRAGLEGKRRTNAVVDGQLVPKSGPRRGPMRKRRRDEPAATPSPRARRPRRAVNYDDSEPDADDDEDLELAPPDDEDGWD